MTPHRNARVPKLPADPPPPEDEPLEPPFREIYPIPPVEPPPAA